MSLYSIHTFVILFITQFIVIYCMKEISLQGNENCIKLLHSFANASANFTHCSIIHSRPITFCKECVYPYTELLISYQNLDKVIDDNDTHCIDMYENLDRLGIVQMSYQYSNNLWNRAKCYECFDHKNGSESFVSSNISKQFDLYYKTFWGCVENKTKEQTHLCQNCMDDYVKLDTYYRSISNVNEDIGVCMDLVDVMNATWTYWSSNCCKFRKHDEYIFIFSTVGVFLLTVLFYVVTKFVATKKIPTILPQRRFVESFGTQST